MDFDEYQREATRTDRLANKDDLMVPLLGLAGEVGSLLTEYKKHLRDGPAHARFEATVAEELGDMLWYLATVASRLNLDLGELAMMNLAKTQDRWGLDDGRQVDLGFARTLPDEAFPAQEQLPRSFAVRFNETVEDGRFRVRMYLGETTVGDPLKDNAYDDDGYRYHDVMHLAHAAVLGWSPVLRQLMKRKRRSNQLVDEVEDGGRAQVIEEAVVACVYEYARHHAFLEGIQTLDYGLLRTLKGLASGLEVARCSFREWEQAVFRGFEVWRQLQRQRTGVVICDLRSGTLTLRS